MWFRRDHYTWVNPETYYQVDGSGNVAQFRPIPKEPKLPSIKPKPKNPVEKIKDLLKI